MINLEKEREGFEEEYLKEKIKSGASIITLQKFINDKNEEGYNCPYINQNWKFWLARAKKAEEEKNKAHIDGYNRSIDEIFKLKEEIESLKKINDDYINRNQVSHNRGKDFDMTGYKFLESGEKIIIGDEFLGADRRWYSANDIGHTVDTNLLRYRRKDNEQYWA